MFKSKMVYVLVHQEGLGMRQNLKHLFNSKLSYMYV